MNIEAIFMLIGAGFIALVAGAIVASRVAERKARDRERIAKRPGRRRRLRRWAEDLDGTYDEDVTLFPSLTATEQICVVVDDVELTIRNVEHRSGDAYGEVRADDLHGRARSGTVQRIGRFLDDDQRRRMEPFDRLFRADPSACPDEVSKRIVLGLKDELAEGQTLLTWADTELRARLRVHLVPGKTLDRLCELVAHVVQCAPEEP